MKIHEAICIDLCNQLQQENTNDLVDDIADIIAALFEFTGNDQFTLYQVTEKLWNYSLTPLESEMDNSSYPK